MVTLLKVLLLFMSNRAMKQCINEEIYGETNFIQC